MSEFYTTISKYYKYIFPTGKAQIQFLSDVIGKTPKRVLDVACGTGEYSKALDKLGYDVKAIDLNESMIEELKATNQNIDSRVLNMLDIDSLEQTFNTIYCIGNSIVHLDNDEKILEFLSKAYEKLELGGNIVLQTINYNRILDKNIEALPLIEDEEVKLKFYRNYERVPGDEKIYFNTLLEVEGRELENQEVLYPIREEKLLSLLEKVGFKNIKKYGSFKKDDYKAEESYVLVVMGEK